ncbi:hypothetical protein COSO111634_00215 [Corallococcus soli]
MAGHFARPTSWKTTRRTGRHSRPAWNLLKRLAGADYFPATKDSPRMVKSLAAAFTSMAEKPVYG